MVERPEIVTDEHLTYLDELRESGVTNMYGAGAYVQREFGVPKKDASAILVYWMKSFEERMNDMTDVTCECGWSDMGIAVSQVPKKCPDCGREIVEGGSK